ncbi:MAG: DUF2493 domain-containing protein [Chthoniobacter sp.]|nr:DUF2493 domain-containing protein [Chthoniobacter sp.]
MIRNDDHEPEHTSSPTDEVLTELQLFGHKPFYDEVDTRPTPDSDEIAGTAADIFDALAGTLTNTRLEPDLHDLLWSMVNAFHRAIDRVQRKLDDNEDAQKRSQREQDGSEIRSVELERLLADGEVLLDRRDSIEAFRDSAAERYEQITGSVWRPHTGSMVNRRAVTAAVIDSRDFVSAKRRAETQVLLPSGVRIAFTGGPDCNEHARIWAALDKVHAKHADMVLLHGGTPTGAERIAACWADARKVAQVVFRPDWNRHRKAAPFKRNDQMLDAMPIGVVAFPGSGISANLCDKARTLGIPVWRDGGA